MSEYPGNASLSNAVKDRVVSTFQQTLALYKQGRTDEVVQGCGLILRMDPLFDPAKKLMEKARNPAAPIDIDQLLVVPAADPMTLARAAMAARNFQKVIDITTEVLTNDLMNDEARVLNETAREKAEATPFVDQFIRKTEQAIAGGDAAAARAGLEKIRSLDADDTAISRIEQAIGKMKPAGSPSFVVDPPPAAGRDTAQASDFGFTFEEEKSGQQKSALSSFSFDAGSTASPFSTDTGTAPPITPPAGYPFDSTNPTPPPKPEAPAGAFSFDTPPPAQSPFAGGFSFGTPPPTPAATPPRAESSSFSGEFDFATASIETSPDDQKKVQEYLAEGDRAFESGDDAKAIDLWSRIFLLDVTNEQASERIEKAKARRKAAENDLEGLLAEGMKAFDGGNRETAREKFAQAIQIDPRNPTAKDYLERLAEVGTEGGAAGYASAFVPSPSTPVSDVFAGASGGASGALEIPSPPAAAQGARIAAKKPAAKAAAKPAPARRELPLRTIGLVIAVIVLGAAGWLAWSKFLSKPKYDPALTGAIFVRANTLADQGKFDAAIAALQDVRVDDPEHDKALSLIADLQHKKAQVSETIAGRPATAVYQESLTNGKAAFDAHDYDAAKKAFDAAARIRPLPPDVKGMYDTVTQQVSKLEGARQLFKEQRYQDALTNLLALQQSDPDNRSVRRMITDAHFNLGAVALQEDHLPDAAREFDEVLKIDPNDELARRSKALADRYSSQSKDLLYKIYVKYLPMRTVG